MSNYSKVTDFAAKDALPSGNTAKVVKGTEIDDELNAISTAVSSKLDQTIGSWSIEQSGVDLVFKYDGSVVLRLDSTGQIVVA